MNTQFLVSPLTSQKLKEFGFNELCYSYYDENDKLCIDKKKKFRNKKLDAKYYTAPHYKDVMNWFERKYNISFEIKVDFYFLSDELVYLGKVFVPDGTPDGEEYIAVKSTALDCLTDLIRMILEALKLKKNKL